MSLLVIIPSRGRPGSITEVIASWRETRSGTHGTELLVVVDDDDPSLGEYLRLDYPAWARLECGPRLRLGPTLNSWAVEAANDYDAIGFHGDDHRPRTQNWDATIVRALAERPGVAYGNDLVHGEGLPTAAFTSAGIVERMGYFCPPGLTHMYLDNYCKLLGQATALHYLPDVVIEHLHPIVDKAEWDAGYDEANSHMEPDRIEYERYLREDWPTERLKLQ